MRRGRRSYISSFRRKTKIQSAENDRKSCHRYESRLCHTVILKERSLVILIWDVRISACIKADFTA